MAAEQNRLMQADTIVLQFPFYWYSYPALLKKWVDEVFVYSFAHGSTGDKVKGKKLVMSFTTGAAA
ncbi:NAD(P)H-dependent oxidoreductase [Gallibacterium anatis]